MTVRYESMDALAQAYQFWQRRLKRLQGKRSRVRQIDLSKAYG